MSLLTTVLDAVTSTASSTMMDVTTTKSANIEPVQPDFSNANHLHYVFGGIIGPIFCFLGMAGNLLAIITWCRPSMRSSTGRYLTGQAIADLGVLLMFVLCDSVQQWNPDIVYSVSYGVFFSYIAYPMLFFTIVLSIWFTVGVTVDRYIMVCWITKAKKFCSEKRANFGLLLITINGFLINLPHFASYTPVYPNENAGNDSKPQMTFAATEFTTGRGGKFYEFWIHCIILILIPWVSVLAMNVKIIKKINASNKKMSDKKTSQSMKKSKESENQITRLLLTVTFTFLFFIGMQCIIQCFFMQEPAWADIVKIKSAFAFGKLGIVFNSSLNFVLYCLTGRRFRMELFKMLGLVKKDAQLSSLMEHPSSGSGHTTSSTGTTGI